MRKSSFINYMKLHHREEIIKTAEASTKDAIIAGKDSLNLKSSDDIGFESEIKDIYNIISFNDMVICYIDIEMKIAAGVGGSRGVYTRTPVFWCIVCLNNYNIEQIIVDYTTKERKYIEKEPFNADEYLITAIRKKDLAENAEMFLKRFYPAAYEKNVPVDPYEVAKRIGLKVKERKLSETGIISGRVVIFDEEIEIFDTIGPRKEFFEAGTILVDPNSKSSKTFTIVHECVHWIYHKNMCMINKFFEDANGNNSEKNLDIHTEEQGRVQSNLLEWQANSLTACILMPEKWIRQRSEELIIEKEKEEPNTAKYIILNKVASQLSNEYGVSFTAAKIRLLNMGYEELNGSVDFVDGKLVPPFTFKQGFLGEKQTFSISFEKFHEACVKSDELAELIKTGDYAFVENHVVLHNEKFVEKVDEKGLILTNYAREHLDKCALVFDTYEKQDKIYRKSNNILYKSSSNREFSYRTGSGSLNPKKAIKAFEELPKEFGQCLSELIKRSGESRKTLEEWFERGKTTVDNFCANNYKQIVPQFDRVCLACAALELEASEIMILFDLAGYSTSINNPRIGKYLNALLSHMSVGEIKEMIDKGRNERY